MPCACPSSLPAPKAPPAQHCVRRCAHDDDGDADDGECAQDPQGQGHTSAYRYGFSLRTYTQGGGHAATGPASTPVMPSTTQTDARRSSVFLMPALNG